MTKESDKLKPRLRDRERLMALEREQLVDIILSLDAKVDHLAASFREMVMQKYGRKTERFTPGQMLLFPGGATRSDQSDSDREPAAKEDLPEKQQPKRAGHSRNPVPEHLLRVSVEPKPPSEHDLACPECSVIRVAVRRILRNSRYGYVPQTFHVEDLYAVIYECPNGHGEPLVSEVDEPVKNGIAAPSLMAQVAVARHVDHMPFNRQTAMYARSGVSLRRSTLSDIHSHSARILKPLYGLLHEILIQSRIISTDDTPVKVLDRSKDKNIKTGRKWAYVGDEEHAVIVFDYTNSRGRDGPLEFLQGFKGLLQGDCFSGNLAIAAACGTILVACLAHARRYFIKALLNEKEGCNAALAMFQSLYEIERTAKELELSFDEIRLMREQEALPLLGKFHDWLQQQYAITQPKSSYGRALFYCLNNWTELTQYVKDGELKIDNNHTEREMKYVSMGKKAWLFFGSDEGGKNDAIVASLIATCRRHGVEPWVYLTDAIQKLTENPQRDLEELLPFKWKGKTEALPEGEITVSKDAPKVISA